MGVAYMVYKYVDEFDLFRLHELHIKTPELTSLPLQAIQAHETSSAWNGFQSSIAAVN